QRGARVILGNHEATFLSRDGERARSAPTINHDHLNWLAEQPESIVTIADGQRLLIVHGSPWEPFKEYIYPTSRGMARFADLDADMVVMGHTHQHMLVRAGGVLLVNSGSAGEARDHRNGRRLSVAVLDTSDQSVQICEYDDPRFVQDGDATPERWLLPATLHM